MFNVLDCILDLSFNSSEPPQLKEKLKLMDRTKDKLFIYRFDLSHFPFGDDAIGFLTKLMSERIGSDINLNPYALYVVWDDNLFLFNLTKERKALKLTRASHLYIAPHFRSVFIEYVNTLPFHKLTDFPRPLRDNFSLLHAMEAQQYNEAIKKLIYNLQLLEGFLIEKYSFEPYFTIHPITHFLFGIPAELAACNSSRKGQRPSSPFADVLAPQPRKVVFKINPRLEEIHQVSSSKHFKEVIPVSPHWFFEHFWKINEKAMRMYDLVQRNNVYDSLLQQFAQQLIEFQEASAEQVDVMPLPVTIMGKLSPQDMLKIVQKHDKECENLLKIPNVSSTLKGLVLQHQMDSELKHFGIDNKFNENTNRLILTTDDVAHGLRIIRVICEANQIDYSNIEHLKAINISHLRIPDSIQLEQAEIAWGTLDVLIRKKPVPYISCSKELVQLYISKLKNPATLVIDGHGGTSDIFIGSVAYSSKKLTTLTTELLEADVNRHINHLILQSCASGKLKPLQTPYYLKNKEKETGKQKMMVIIPPAKPASDFFLKADKMPICLAESVINAILAKKLEDRIAFTFSTSLINPSYILGNGNVGVRPQVRLENTGFTTWGAYVTPERFSGKTVSFFWGPDHPKLKNLPTKYSGPLENLPIEYVQKSFLYWFQCYLLARAKPATSRECILSAHMMLSIKESGFSNIIPMLTNFGSHIYDSLASQASIEASQNGVIKGLLDSFQKELVASNGYCQYLSMILRSPSIFSVQSSDKPDLLLSPGAATP